MKIFKRNCKFCSPKRHVFGTSVTAIIGTIFQIIFSHFVHSSFPLFLPFVPFFSYVYPFLYISISQVRRQVGRYVRMFLVLIGSIKPSSIYMFRCLFLLLNLFDVFCIYLPYQNSMLEKNLFLSQFRLRKRKSPQWLSQTVYHSIFVIVYLQ